MLDGGDIYIQAGQKGVERGGNVCAASLSSVTQRLLVSKETPRGSLKGRDQARQSGEQTHRVTPTATPTHNKTVRALTHRMRFHRTKR